MWVLVPFELLTLEKNSSASLNWSALGFDALPLKDLLQTPKSAEAKKSRSFLCAVDMTCWTVWTWLNRQRMVWHSSSSLYCFMQTQTSRKGQTKMSHDVPCPIAGRSLCPAFFVGSWDFPESNYSDHRFCCNFNKRIINLHHYVHYSD